MAEPREARFREEEGQPDAAEAADAVSFFVAVGRASAPFAVFSADDVVRFVVFSPRLPAAWLRVDVPGLVSSGASHGLVVASGKATPAVADISDRL